MSTRKRTTSGGTVQAAGKAGKSERNGRSSRKSAASSRAGSSGPIAFFVALFIVLVAAIQLVSTFNSYANDLAHLNSLKRQEASLIAQKKELENDIARWDDKSYVAAQARERLGFVFPGELSVHVLNPQAVTGKESDKASKNSESEEQKLPWYSELSYAFKEADQSDNK
ncbi:septum formation initiator [Bifidobacterium sp. DSM 109960]|uniref:Septum formation initiator n=1 Tax=Bifidobacterium erythrocebi TaxID=2675325 RepID=A0A7Y0EUW9_9BIFI|nr:septum formation initiator [Bifidobacterium sp. DSM 109960]